MAGSTLSLTSATLFRWIASTNQNSGDADMKPCFGRVLSGTVAVFLAAGMVGHARAAPVKARGPLATRIVQIMRRLGDVRRFGAVSVAPDGRSIAWTMTGTRPVHGAKPAGGSTTGNPGEILQLADIDGTHVRTVRIPGAVKTCHYSSLTWSPDSRILAFLSNCNHGRKYREQLDVYEVAANAVRARRITHLRGFVHELTWVPGGSMLSFLYVKGDLHPIAAVSATKPQVGVIGRTGVEHQQLAVVPATGGKVSEITPYAIFVYEYDWSPSGTRVVYVGAPPPGRDNWWVAKLYTQRYGGPARVVLDPATVKGSLHGLQIALPRWSPNGSHIALIGGLMSDQGATGGDIYIISSRGGQPTDVTPGIGITPSWLTWTGNDSLLVSAFAGGSTRVSEFTLHAHSPATQRTLFTVASNLWDGTFASAISVSAAHRVLAFVESTFDNPPEIATVVLKTNAAAQPIGVLEAAHAITRVNAGVRPMWGKAVSVHWRNEGFNVQGWLLFPAHYDPRRHYPMIVYVHGGPSWATRPGWPYDGYGAAPFAAMGYFVFMPNPRGSFGEGERFAKAIRRNMGYGDLRDILAGIDHVEAEYPIDNDRLGLTGWSYGGFMSMFAPTQTHRFKAAVAAAGLSDWESYYGENSIDKWMIPFFGASVYQDPKVYAKSSAINFIQNDKTPTLVVVGQYDGECPAPQSFEFWHALRAMHVPTELVVYAGEGHGFHKTKDLRNVLERALRWFAKYLSAKPAA
jgi:dipeptidyl aminopeptidase/acylaminoacyl peptidase